MSDLSRFPAFQFKTAPSYTAMKGECRKSRKREPSKKPKRNIASGKVSSSIKKDSNATSDRDLIIVGPKKGTIPERGKGRTKRTQQAPLTSTSVCSTTTDIQSNISIPGVNQAEVLSHVQTSNIDSLCSKPKCRGKRKRSPHAQAKRLRKRATKTQAQTCNRSGEPPAKLRCDRSQKIENGNLKDNTTVQPFSRCRPRFELKNSDTASADDSVVSSDLSIELNAYEEQLPLSLQENEESEEEEEELPSFLMQTEKKPQSITEGAFVWHKFRSYPFWPAWVKSVNRKQKKASIMFIDYSINEKKRGFAVALRSLKPFDCEEANELVSKAKESYDATITWSLELITDYRFRIACGSFSGSFIKYFDHDMSYPVRRKCPQAASDRLTIITELMTEDPCVDHKEDNLNEQEEVKHSLRLLPDRSHVAINRANEKLVHFIVKQRMVEQHLLAVMHGQQQSRWLRYFLSASGRRIVNIYLENDQQLDRVYRYLDELYTMAVEMESCLVEVKSLKRVSFVLDVLLPEAIIHAIAGVDNISVKKAEEKYLKGRCLSNRERQQFDLMLERQMKTRSHHQSTAFALFTDPVI
ncbi:PWWP domain-containing DNA repair factor 3A-like [Pholidichthys leucotaenia]